jgi:hypothetical protein
LQELKALLKVSTTTPQTAKKPTQEEGFQEVRRQKRHSSNEAAQGSPNSNDDIGDRSACRSQHHT